MFKSKDYMLQELKWYQAAGDIVEIRKKVFVVEQRFDMNKICDSLDDRSFHVIALDLQNNPIGSGRLTPAGRIGKIAVLINHRGRGIGTQILSELINIAKARDIEVLSLNAEAGLVNFYDQQKFYVDGPVYMKQGIPFQRMAKRLA